MANKTKQNKTIPKYKVFTFSPKIQSFSRNSQDQFADYYFSRQLQGLLFKPIIINNITDISPRLGCRKAIQAAIPGVRLHRQACELYGKEYDIL